MKVSNQLSIIRNDIEDCGISTIGWGQEWNSVAGGSGKSRWFINFENGKRCEVTILINEEDA